MVYRGRYTGLSYCSVTYREAGIPACRTVASHIATPSVDVKRTRKYSDTFKRSIVGYVAETEYSSSYRIRADFYLRRYCWSY
ncbi:hypothetical protein LSAT2_001866 [Lamellibrachia satsuma]|nr:hypothetical protein LSAT2_001866 [Lamellibrachia satsuma]